MREKTSIAKMAKRSGRSEDDVRRSICKLVELGVLTPIKIRPNRVRFIAGEGSEPGILDVSDVPGAVVAARN